MGTWYTTREDVMSAQDIKATAYSGRDIDRAIESASRSVEGLLHRSFYPWVGTRYFDFPADQYAKTWRLWFGRFDLIAATAVLNGDGLALALADVNFEPQDGPPYDHMEIDRGTASSFLTGDTNQRAVAVTGTWGFTDDEETVGTTVEALDLTETGVDGSGMPTVGVGSILRVGTEQMVVVEKGWLSTSQTGSLSVQNNAQALTVADGTAFVAGEVLLLDAERVKVVDIAGNVLSVKRAVDGTTLAVHSTATIYAQRTLTVVRGALGTTAATHLTGVSVYRWVPPGPVAELTLAYAVDALLQRQAGYARTAGEGENEKEMTGRGIKALESRAKIACGRQARKGAI